MDYIAQGLEIIIEKYCIIADQTNIIETGFCFFFHLKQNKKNNKKTLHLSTTNEI